GAEIALTDAARHIIHQARTDLNRQAWALERLSPQNQVNTFRQQIDSLTHRAGRALQHRLDLQRQQIAGLASRLETLNPQATLSRGYAIVQKDNTVVSQTQQVDQNDRIVVKVSDGEFEAIVQTSGR
ncbi:MAG: hypothetical protein KDJ97_01585, partial [Anaerolineae bacterium]|nr:hypothetical protein [Anaerolineae bacterium]